MTMPRLAMILLFCSMNGLAFGTFEIQDPAAEIFAEKQAPEVNEERLDEQVLEEETFCAVDTETGECWCVHKKTATVITIEHEICVARATAP
jgi:hypothetical protein